MNTPKAFANFSPRFEHARTLGHNSNPEGFDVGQTVFQSSIVIYLLIPGLSLRSNPGLKLANAFGVSLVKLHTDALLINISQVMSIRFIDIGACRY